LHSTQTLRLVFPLVLIFASSKDAAAADLAARGLDLFVHVPKQAATGGIVPLQLRVFGFPTVSTLLPLPGAQVEATWDPESLGPAMKGVDWVFHAAASVSMWKGSWEQSHKINVGGTRNMVEAALNAGVKRFVHTSSINALGLPKDGEVGDESLEWNLPFDFAYNHSKREGEKEVQKGVRQGLQAVIMAAIIASVLPQVTTRCASGSKGRPMNRDCLRAKACRNFGAPHVTAYW